MLNVYFFHTCILLQSFFIYFTQTTFQQNFNKYNLF